MQCSSSINIVVFTIVLSAFLPRRPAAAKKQSSRAYHRMLSVAAAGNRGRLVAATACFLVALLQQLQVRSATATATPPRAFFVFGDSLVDNGNNNYLMTTARADSPPYGIDYPTHRPTGRFSNGKNIPDIISTAGRLPSLSLSRMWCCHVRAR